MMSVLASSTASTSRVERVNWFSTYHIHHRVAEHFRDGRAFLLGDTAHIHSPVGGQGMNTGIGDAVNLAWKLAAVLQGRADPSLLDSYEPERIAFARRLVATTDRAFQLREARRLMFLTLSQTNVNYRGSALSTGSAERVVAGDRLPWVCQEDGTDNFVSLAAVFLERGRRQDRHRPERLLPCQTGRLCWFGRGERCRHRASRLFRLAAIQTSMTLRLTNPSIGHVGRFREYQ
jgi:hypothetical protein